VTALTDLTGRVIEQYWYSPYGQLEAHVAAHPFDFDDDGDVDAQDIAAGTSGGTCWGDYDGASGDCKRLDADGDRDIDVDDYTIINNFLAARHSEAALQRIPAASHSRRGNLFAHQGLPLDAELAGNGPIKLRTLLRTRRECRQASYDSDSGRVATVEDDGDRDVIRLYAPDSTLLGEYQCASRLRRQGVSKPCFDTGGTRIAFVCKEDAVCHADVETLNQKETVRVFRAPKVDQRSRGPHRLTCFWASDQSLVAGFDGEIYSIAANGEVKRLSSEGANQLLLCGIIGETPELELGRS
jgi:hypothetical protein